MIPHVVRLNWNYQRERRKWRKRIREKEAPGRQGSPQQRPVEESSPPTTTLIIVGEESVSPAVPPIGGWSSMTRSQSSVWWGVAAAKCVLHSDEPCAQAQDS